jgi:hypothetical protein
MAEDPPDVRDVEHHLMHPEAVLLLLPAWLPLLPAWLSLLVTCSV